MRFRPEEYLAASTERMRQAITILRDDEASYALAMYCAGVAVECMLRAFHTLDTDAPFDSKHDIHALLRASKMLQVNPAQLRKKRIHQDQIDRLMTEVNAAITEIAILWDNGLRYASEARLRTFLLKRGRLGKVRGNPLKKNATDLVGSAKLVVDRGVTLWMLARR